MHSAIVAFLRFNGRPVLTSRPARAAGPVPVCKGSQTSFAGAEKHRIADFVHGQDGFGNCRPAPSQVRRAACYQRLPAMRMLPRAASRAHELWRYCRLHSCVMLARVSFAQRVLEPHMQATAAHQR